MDPSERLMSGQLYGKIPSLSRSKDWVLFYLELSQTELHIFEGHVDITHPRKHLRSLEMAVTDLVFSERDRKTFRFCLKKTDGTYTFRCVNEMERQSWISALERAINYQRSLCDSSGKRHERQKMGDLSQAPVNYSLCSGLSQVVQPSIPPISVGGDSSSSPGSSGSGSFSVGNRGPQQSRHSHSHSGDGNTPHRVPLHTTQQTSVSDSAQFDSREELENYPWFWGHMDRSTCERRMRSEGKVGNFAIRINAKGEFVMTFWRGDAIHHHRIIHQCGIYRFEKTAVSAEGLSLVDLLDNYMKNCTDKKIVPIGGQLHLVYDQPWNPPDIDMEQLQKKLSEMKRLEDRKRVLEDIKSSPQQSRDPKKRKDQYSLVSGTTESEKVHITSQPTNFRSLPSGKSNGQFAPTKQVSDPQILQSTKLLPPTPAAKPGAKHHKPLPNPPTAAKISPTHQLLSTNSEHEASSKKNNPLPPVPDTLTASASHSAKPESSGRHSPRGKKSPSFIPRKNVNKNTSPTPLVEAENPDKPFFSASLPSTRSSELQEQCIYMNTSHNMKPLAKPRSSNTLSTPTTTTTTTTTTACDTTTSSANTPSLKPYQNIGVGEVGGQEEEAIYANMVAPRVAARRRGGGGGREGRRATEGGSRGGGRAQAHSQCKQLQEAQPDTEPSVAYQNVSYNGQSWSDTPYENVGYSH